MNSNIVKLVKVDGNVNNNKFYIMEKSGSEFIAKYGRVGKEDSPAIKRYPLSKWDSTYRSKIRKGYQDQTAFLAVKESEKKYADIKNAEIANFVDTIMQYASASITKNYTVSADAVTDKQLNAAQEIIDDLVGYRNIGEASSTINKKLTDLYMLIPRKMKQVKNHMLQFPKIATQDDLLLFDKLIGQEQDLLDTLKGQVVTSGVQKDTESHDKTILELMNLDLFETNKSEEAIIRKMTKGAKGKIRRTFRAVNKKTEALFKESLSDSKNKSTELYWHGSRNENWWSIFKAGLTIRPSNAVYTGSMFGDGIYFSPIAQKSLGYTSLRGAYWTGGYGNRGYMGIYDVHIGKQLELHRHSHECYRYSWNVLQNKSGGPYDSVYAHAGADLRNPELIIYQGRQSTIRYLVEFES